jgi:mono/diheme cytochrome c family protein
LTGNGFLGRAAVGVALAIWAAGAVAFDAATPSPAAQVARDATSSSGDPDGRRASALDPDQARQTLDRYCLSCHNSRTAGAATASGVVLDRLDLSRVGADAEQWEKVVHKLRTGAMPPAGMPRPDKASSDGLATWLEAGLDRAAVERPRPGRPALHRLNRAEYANAIRDLLALDVDASSLLPPDDSADGFDNNADILGVSPALLERYLSAAAKVSALAIGSEAITAGSETYRVRGDASQTEHLDGLPLGTRGGILAEHTFPLDGEYVFKVKLLETNLGSIRGLESESQLEITVDDGRVLLAPVGGPADYEESARNATNVVNSLETRLQVRALVRAGQRPVTAAFLQKSSALGGWRLQPFERSTLIATDHLGLPHVENMTITGPFAATGSGDTPSRRRLFTCGSTPLTAGRPARPQDERPCAETIVSTLARRAYRRPVTPADLSGLMGFYDQGRRDGFEAGIGMALRAMLASPKFVFRVERDPAGAASGSVQPVSDVDLASRLSFFLWSSLPDEELIDQAARGRLSNRQVLSDQMRRMLADRKSDALVANFANQWLHVRNLRSATPDKNDFPDFDDNLRRAFERELEMFFASIIREDRSVLDLLSADYTFVNERLAKHYGMPNVSGSHFRRVTVSDDVRRGLLGKGGILLVTSHADRTSPVARGKWILDNLVGAPPPPPPADVPALPEPTGAQPLTMRARMERHRANPACASCHRQLDPLGLAMENFDAVGKWRRLEGGQPIDVSGELGDGTKVNGVVALRQALLAQPDVIVRTMAEKMLTYALGRGLRYTDMPAVRAIVRHASANGYRFSSLVEGVVMSVPFRMREAGS